MTNESVIFLTISYYINHCLGSSLQKMKPGDTLKKKKDLIDNLIGVMAVFSLFLHILSGVLLILQQRDGAKLNAFF